MELQNLFLQKLLSQKNQPFYNLEPYSMIIFAIIWTSMLGTQERAE